MVYRHRTQSGRIINFKNKSSYENWKKGMFANMHSSNSSRRKITRANSKSRRKMNHKAGIGKVSSKGEYCKYCRKKKHLTEGRCKDCAQAFKEYNQPKELTEDIKRLSEATGMDAMAIADMFSHFSYVPENLNIKEIYPIGEDGWQIELDSNEGEFRIFKNYGGAKQFAIDDLYFSYSENPEIIPDAFLFNQLSMTDADIRMRATQEAEDRYDWEAYSVEDLKHRFGKGWDETRSREQLIKDAKYEKYKEIKKELEEDPYQYYVINNGFYSKEELLYEPWIKYDEYSIAEDVVNTNGATTHLGEEYKTKDGYYAYKVA